MILFNNLENIGLLILRLVLFFVFVYHGGTKLFGKQTSKGYRFLGFVEFISSIAILLGLFAEFAAIILAVIMLGAIYMKIVKWKIPFSAMDKIGWELDLILLAAALTILLLGGGNISLDAIA